LGLVPAVKSLCRELSGRRGLHIEFINSEAPAISDSLDKETALCAYRVIQEALTNVIKHAGALRARVELKRQRRMLCFYITDSGTGFNVEEARLKGRLGLISMEERLRLANGELIIRSKPMRGTQIEARIPIASRSQA
jgi:signal transduction histidine kinase